eukprot:CAMPEP_0171228186 /NCGR_PEP_ID=MMETSP0790-20130122/38236_1 /TAXON_ID=2925 /ORGANISM="Alexandrium catenella, Strain OF101" /LENGTH=162 /DNA_ID=CAMNT_0011694329 /DNA_START=53 /DNA_END=538 /DNA_ORIENTATION=+
MTLVFEAAAAVAFGSALLSRNNARLLQEENAARDLYKQFFGNQDLLEQSDGKVTERATGLPAELHAQAAKSIRIIEEYQKTRGGWGKMFGADGAGDARSRILEELKQWLLTVTEGVDAASVATRLDYCSQFLLRPSVFQASNEQSFLGTLAQVCAQLEGLLR